jgi:DNA-binding NtrC family response regulator
MGASILLVEDDPNAQELIRESIENAGEGFHVRGVSTARRALEHLAAHKVDCVLLDLDLPDAKGLKLLHKIRDLRPDLPVILVTAYGKPSMIVEAMKLGAVHYVVKDGMYLSELVTRTRVALGGRELERALHPPPPQVPLKPALRDRYRLDGLIGDSPAMQTAIAAAEKAAHSRATVLLQGETGTGKELFARAIHYHGLRANGPFIIVNCPAIPKDLLESELFGHVKGAFTGATEARRGFFEIADGGTIFLDEIGEIDTSVQQKLLRVLQEGEVHPVGADFTRRVHVRVIAASNRDLRGACEQGTFRPDLYYRVGALPITLPPLRDRRSDVALLFRHFLKRFEEEEHKDLGGVDPQVLRCLEGYSWHGNVRQLRNEAHRIVSCVEPGERVTLDMLSPEVRVEGTLDDEGGTLREIRGRVEAAVITGRLRKHGYNRARTARSLGITREHLLVKMRQLGIEVPVGTDANA